MFENTVVVDCRGHLLGRLCSIIAKELMSGQRVVLVRCEEMNISGRYALPPALLPALSSHNAPFWRSHREIFFCVDHLNAVTDRSPFANIFLRTRITKHTASSATSFCSCPSWRRRTTPTLPVARITSVRLRAWCGALSVRWCSTRPRAARLHSSASRSFSFYIPVCLLRFSSNHVRSNMSNVAYSSKKRKRHHEIATVFQAPRTEQEGE